MAKLSGPLLSTAASGRFRENFYFTTSRQGSTIRRFRPSSALPTPEQVAQRTFVHDAIYQWWHRNWTAEDSALWLINESLRPRRWTRYNNFLSLILTTLWPGGQWYPVRCTGYQIQPGGQLRMWVAVNPSTPDPWFHWGFSRSCPEAPILMTIDGGHGGDFVATTPQDLRGRRVWFFAAWDGYWAGYGQSPLAYLDVPV